MAIKEKQKDQLSQASSKLREILTTEYKWETYLLGFLSVLAIALSSLIFNGSLAIASDAWLIGGYPKVFAGIVLGVGILGILLFLIPIFKPAFPELRKLSFPSGKSYAADLARTFIFVIVMVLVFLLYDAFLAAILSKINF